MDTSDLSERENSTSSILADLNDRLISGGLVKRPLKFTSLLEALFEGERSVQDETGKKIRRESVERELEGLCKALSGIMSQKKADLLQLESLSASRQVLQYDHDRMVQKHSKLQRSASHLEKDKETLRAQLVASDQKVKRQEVALKASRDEAIRSRAALAGLRTQYTHELKKHELEREKLMQGWQKVANEGARTNSWTQHRGHQGLLLLNPIEGQAQGPRADTFWDPSIADLEMKIDNLREECEAFRHVTLSTAHQLQGILGAVEEQDIPRIASSAFFSLPSSSSRSQVASSITHPKAADARLRDLIHQLKRRVEEVSDERREAIKAREDWRRDLDGLLEGERVQRVREVLENRIREMEAQLESALHGQPLVTTPTVDSREFERQDLEEQERRSQLLATAAAEKEALENERRQFAEVMIRLGNEKALFQAEKAAFEENARAQRLEQDLRERELQAKMEAAEAQAAAAAAMPDSLSLSSATPEVVAETWSDVVPTPQAAPAASSSNPNSPSAAKATSRRKPGTSLGSGATTSRTRPAVSSPLRGSQSRMLLSTSQRSPHGGGKRLGPGGGGGSSAANAASGRGARLGHHRVAKGPATPLARYVTHKLVAEKLASAKKQQRQQQLRSQSQQSSSEPRGSSDSSESSSEGRGAEVKLQGSSTTAREPAGKGVEAAAVARPRPLGSVGTLANRGATTASSSAPAATYKKQQQQPSGSSSGAQAKVGLQQRARGFVGGAVPISGVSRPAASVSSSARPQRPR